MFKDDRYRIFDSPSKQKRVLSNPENTQANPIYHPPPKANTSPIRIEITRPTPRRHPLPISIPQARSFERPYSLKSHTTSTPSNTTSSITSSTPLLKPSRFGPKGMAEPMENVQGNSPNLDDLDTPMDDQGMDLISTEVKDEPPLTSGHLNTIMDQHTNSMTDLPAHRSFLQTSNVQSSKSFLPMAAPNSDTTKKSALLRLVTLNLLPHRFKVIQQVALKPTKKYQIDIRYDGRIPNLSRDPAIENRIILQGPAQRRQPSKGIQQAQMEYAMGKIFTLMGQYISELSIGALSLDKSGCLQNTILVGNQEGSKFSTNVKPSDALLGAAWVSPSVRPGIGLYFPADISEDGYPYVDRVSVGPSYKPRYRMIDYPSTDGNGFVPDPRDAYILHIDPNDASVLLGVTMLGGEGCLAHLNNPNVMNNLHHYYIDITFGIPEYSVFEEPEEILRRSQASRSVNRQLVRPAVPPVELQKNALTSSKIVLPSNSSSRQVFNLSLDDDLILALDDSLAAPVTPTRIPARRPRKGKEYVPPNVLPSVNDPENPFSQGNVPSNTNVNALGPPTRLRLPPNQEKVAAPVLPLANPAAPSTPDPMGKRRKIDQPQDHSIPTFKDPPSEEEEDEEEGEDDWEAYAQSGDTNTSSYYFSRSPDYDYTSKSHLVYPKYKFCKEEIEYQNRQKQLLVGYEPYTKENRHLKWYFVPFRYDLRKAVKITCRHLDIARQEESVMYCIDDIETHILMNPHLIEDANLFGVCALMPTGPFGVIWHMLATKIISGDFLELGHLYLAARLQIAHEKEMILYSQKQVRKKKARRLFDSFASGFRLLFSLLLKELIRHWLLWVCSF